MKNSSLQGKQQHTCGWIVSFHFALTFHDESKLQRAHHSQRVQSEARSGRPAPLCTLNKTTVKLVWDLSPRDCGTRTTSTLPSNICNAFLKRCQKWTCVSDRCHSPLRTVRNKVLIIDVLFCDKSFYIWFWLLWGWKKTIERLIIIFILFFVHPCGSLQGSAGWTSSAVSSSMGARCRLRWGNASWSSPRGACVPARSRAGCAWVTAASAKYWPGKLIHDGAAGWTDWGWKGDWGRIYMIVNLQIFHQWCKWCNIFM